jgi:hypothetical protein
MKKLMTIFTVLSLISCKKEVSKTEIKKEKVPEMKVWVSKNQKFLDKFKTVDFDTLKVYSIDNIENDIYYKFKGDSLKGNEVLPVLFFLSHEEIEGFENADFHTVNKFNLDNDELGLIARTMGEYWASSIKLYSYNKQKDKIVNFIELAEKSGDAGDSFNKRSWIFKDKNNSCKIFIWTHFEHDNTVEDEPKTPNYKEDNYYLIRSNQGKFDTISENNKQLEKQFAKIIKKENLK